MKIRKNDKAYLQDFKIDIRTKNDVYYQELALLFDKPNFLNLLPNLRQTYGIANLFPLSDIDKLTDSYFKENLRSVTIDLSKYSKVDEVKELFPEFYELLIGKGITDFLPEMLDAESNLICYEFNRPPYFVEPIYQAIFCGIVDDSYFKPTEAKIVNFEQMGSWPTLERIAIFVSPTSTYEEVKEEFRKAKELMKNNKRMSYYHAQVDKAPNIRKYREWYWERIRGKTYKQIADEWNEKHNNETSASYIDALKAVKTYEKLLAS